MTGTCTSSTAALRRCTSLQPSFSTVCCVSVSTALLRVRQYRHSFQNDANIANDQILCSTNGTRDHVAFLCDRSTVMTCMGLQPEPRFQHSYLVIFLSGQVFIFSFCLCARNCSLLSTRLRPMHCPLPFRRLRNRLHVAPLCSANRYPTFKSPCDPSPGSSICSSIPCRRRSRRRR